MAAEKTAIKGRADVKASVALLLWVLMASMNAQGALGGAAAAGLAAKYKQDTGIGKDPAVLFAEDFEESTVQDVSARWSETHNGAGMSLDKDVPAGSPSGSHSIRMTSVGGSTDGGHLYKRIPGQDRIYLRFYMKHANGGTYHHSGGGMGGYYPPSNYALGQAGMRPTGSDRIAVRAERVTGSDSRFDYYAYWPEMRGNPADASFWGNHLINDQNVAMANGEWACVEYMIKVNSPVASRNGEMAMWLNGKQVSNLGPGYPKGKWTYDNFKPDSSGQPFEGFLWRRNEALDLNWIRLSHYVSADPAGYKGMMWFDQMVLATQYIGCMGQDAPVPTGMAKTAPDLAASVASIVRGPGNSILATFKDARQAGDASMTISDLGGRPVPGWSVRRNGTDLIAQGPLAGAGRQGMVIATLSHGGMKTARKILLTGP